MLSLSTQCLNLRKNFFDKTHTSIVPFKRQLHRNWSFDLKNYAPLVLFSSITSPFLYEVTYKCYQTRFAFFSIYIFQICNLSLNPQNAQPSEISRHSTEIFFRYTEIRRFYVDFTKSFGRDTRFFYENNFIRTKALLLARN